jgi:hypothetical protein
MLDAREFVAHLQAITRAAIKERSIKNSKECRRSSAGQEL